jgi:hypothetical protein
MGSTDREARSGTTAWKQPPIVKVYEAFTAVSGGHVSIVEPGRALVTSSDGARTYTVSWSEGGSSMISDDNGSRWQGYAGYPIIAVLLERGSLQADEAVTAPLAGVDWHELNDRFKRRYDAAIEHVLAEAAAGGADREAIAAAAEEVLRQLADLHLQRAGRRRP